MIRHPDQMKQETRERMRGGEGAVTIRHYFESGDFAAKVRLCARLVLPPGASIGRHEHVAEDEVYIVLRGRGALHDGIRETPVAAGDAVLTGRGGAHAVRNTGGEDLEIIAVIMCYDAA